MLSLQCFYPGPFQIFILHWRWQLLECGLCKVHIGLHIICNKVFSSLILGPTAEGPFRNFLSCDFLRDGADGLLFCKACELLLLPTHFLCFVSAPLPGHVQASQKTQTWYNAWTLELTLRKWHSKAACLPDSTCMGFVGLCLRIGTQNWNITLRSTKTWHQLTWYSSAVRAVSILNNHASSKEVRFL